MNDWSEELDEEQDNSTLRQMRAEIDKLKEELRSRRQSPESEPTQFIQPTIGGQPPGSTKMTPDEYIRLVKTNPLEADRALERGAVSFPLQEEERARRRDMGYTTDAYGNPL